MDAHQAAACPPRPQRRDEETPIADWGQIIAQRSDTQAVGPDSIVAVQRVTVETHPSMVVFDLLLPEREYTTQAGAFDEAKAVLAIRPIAQQIEYYISSGQVQGAEYAEDLNPSGLVEFYMDFIVTIEPPSNTQIGEHTMVVRVPLVALGERILIDSLVAPKIARAREYLEGFAHI